MATVIYALIALLPFAVPSAAQTIRVEVIADEQAEKATAVGPEAWTKTVFAYFRRNSTGWTLVGFERQP